MTPTQKHKRATQKDIARDLGLSQKAVSDTVRDTHRTQEYAPETIDAVREHAAVIGYEHQPSLAHSRRKKVDEPVKSAAVIINLPIRKETLTLKSPYDETYEALATTFGISKTETGFDIWKSGCKVGEAPDIYQARQRVHALVRAQCAHRRSALEQELKRVNDTETQLTDDWFRIARFERGGS